MTVSALTVSISGTIYPVRVGSWSIGDQLDQITQCSFTIQDDAGAWHFSKGQQVTVADSVAGTLFTGFIETCKEQKIPGQSSIQHEIACNDNEDILARRTTNAQYSNQYSGVIMAGMINDVLSAEGITANYAVHTDTSQSDFATGTLSGTVATTTAGGDGALQLAAAGSDMSYTDTNLITSSSPAIKFTATCVAGFTNPYAYRKIYVPPSTLTIASGDYLSYDIWISSTSPEIKGGIDFVCTDGTTFRDSTQAATGTDSQGLVPHPGTVLDGLANDQWYSRSFHVSGALVGKVISYFSIAQEGDTAGEYIIYVRNVRWNGASSVKNHIFDSTQSTLQSNGRLQYSGYQNGGVDDPGVLHEVTVYDPLVNSVQSHSISSVGIVKSSYISWVTGTNGGTSGFTNGGEATLQTSIDGGITWQTATSGAAIPNLQAGMNVSGVTLQYRASYTLGTDPTNSNYFASVKTNVYTSYSSSKADVKANYSTQANFNTGTNSSTTNQSSGGVTLLSGFTRNWDDGQYASDQVLFGATSPVQGVYNKQFYLQTGSGTDVRSRLDGPGNLQNFTAEADVLVIDANSACGFIYRTTAQNNNNNTYAYTITISTTQLTLGYGTNSTSGTGGFTSLSVIAITLSGNTRHKLKILINGSNHQAFVDDIPYLNFNDSTYTATGKIGLRFYNNTGSTQTAYFDNFGVAAITSTLTGTWVSPAISLTSAANYGNSVIQWNDNTSTVSGATVGMETTINGGSSWQAVTNGGAISGLTAGQSLSGVNLQLRATLTANSPGALPILSSLTAWIQGQYSASGTRIAPVLSLAPASRAGSTLVAWNASTPTNTSVAVATSLDNITYNSVTNGGSIAGITSQGAQVLDTFDANTSANYTQTNRTGGTGSTWTWDTTNSRLTGAGGSDGLLIYNAVTIADIDITVDMNQAPSAGIIFRYQDASNYYLLMIQDGSAPVDTNTVRLFKNSANTYNQVSGTATISFTRGTPHRFRVTMLGSVVTAYMDGSQVLTYTDGSAFGAGKVGLRNATNGATTAQFYNFIFLPQGDDLTGKSVYVKTTLTSTDATATPQLLDITTAALSPDIGKGSLVTVDYRNTYISDNVSDLVQKSNYYSKIRPNKSLIFQDRRLISAPWILTSSDALLDGCHVERSGDLYRNRQILTGVLDTATFTEKKEGDGSATSWALGYQVVSAPTITLNGQSQSVGVKGVDSGKAYYWEYGSETITQDASGTVLKQDVDSLTITYTGQFTTSVTRNNTSMTGTITQSAFAALAGGTGIVENIEDVTEQKLTVAQANSYGDTLLQRYGVIGRTVPFRTLRAGLATGQYLPVFLPEHGINDAAMLITQVNTTMTPTVDSTTGQNTVQYWYDCQCTEGPNLGSWIKLFSS